MTLSLACSTWGECQTGRGQPDTGVSRQRVGIQHRVRLSGAQAEVIWGLGVPDISLDIFGGVTLEVEVGETHSQNGQGGTNFTSRQRRAAKAGGRERSRLCDRSR